MDLFDGEEEDDDMVRLLPLDGVPAERRGADEAVQVLLTLNAELPTAYENVAELYSLPCVTTSWASFRGSSWHQARLSTCAKIAMGAA